MSIAALSMASSLVFWLSTYNYFYIAETYLHFLVSPHNINVLQLLWFTKTEH
ncbi:hypothetical protein VCRA2121O436_350048 [Vibrio crassostreae]|nr:hypothetical protein VCRA2121O436_350048 [Vibrio crassostreae]